MQLTHSNAEPGMRVKLTHPQGHYTIGSNNPAIGTKFECVGTIKSVGKLRGDANIVVVWDNRHKNSYHGGTLSIAEDEGHCDSIW